MSKGVANNLKEAVCNAAYPLCSKHNPAMYKLIFVFLFLLGPLIFSFPADAKQPHRKVLILGAGLSGIVAGKTLKDKGIDDFLLLEGQNYIGGRIKQGEIAGFKVEKGANWYHYAKKENDTIPIWKLKLKHNLKGIWSNYSDFIIRDQNGKDQTDLEAHRKLLDVFSNIEELQEKRNNLPNIPARVGLALNGWKPKTPAQYVLEYFEIDFENAKQSELVPFNGLIEKGIDFFLTDQRGMWSTYKDLYEGFKEKIVLNKTVKEIRYSAKLVTVITDDGAVYTADYALSTFSNGVLASDMVKFTPPLPKWKQEAILMVPMSVYTKIFLKFPRKFWDNHEYILHAGRTRENFPVFQDLTGPGIFPSDSGLLLITVTGDEARRIEKQTFQETKAEIVKMLKGVYGPDIPEPTDVLYPRWSLNKYVQGSYSDSLVGSSEETFKNLSKNLGNLYFSGEGTCEKWYGYMQGAYLTGQKQAGSIAKRILQ